MAKNKYYVVWVGAKPGIYKSWPECQAQIKGFPAAKYKGFATLEEAQAAYSNGFSNYISSATGGRKTKTPSINSRANIISNSIAVDAACSGNPGVMEYQGVYTKDERQLFHQKFNLGTNNIGEFLALVHGISYLQKNNLNIPIYSDSKIAIGWVMKKQCKSKLAETAKTKELFELVRRAEHWLKTNTINVKILKWDTKNWGEIPADFGRK
ncbi:ribonuclease H family protein [Carboxylicivirga sp. A043]|uniref:ribonuclease H family protein n=1 Tax=Carboxylicivirga litoralis TaxID=2816963 RepID=UPI0021CB845F|nr:ribonuclease H family protein [Carboxylicivirga sp. A043]MCU4156418.1 ribonuclease H family protein [Carboxylicivirga sp. A043]